MKKYVFTGLTIELTRRCNMACRHCLRGDAQNLTISKEIIDKIFSDTENCLQLYVAVGEPLLEPEILKYLLDKAGSNWGVTRLEITTNGSILDSTFVDALEQFCKVSFPHKLKLEKKGITRIAQLTVSNDRFHVAGVAQRALEFYQPLFDAANKRLGGSEPKLIVKTWSPINEDEVSQKNDLTRLIFLSTFCGYSEQGNKLMLTSKTQMHKNDLSEILKVSKSTAERFLREVSPRYVTESNDGYLFLNSDIFVKGILDRGSSYYRFYADWVRQLYHATEMKKHKLLGYLFQMIPFVNREYNLLCHNPQEKDFDLVEILTLDEFIEKIGYNKSDRHRLIKIYKNLVFPVGDHMERFCSVVSNGVVQDNGKAKLYINPNILYSGSRYDEVRILGKFCKD